MATTIFTTLTEQELEVLILRVLAAFHAKPEPYIDQSLSEIGGIELAMEVTGLKRPTIYGLTSTGGIPCMRRGKKLYFRKSELIAWIEGGRKNTPSAE